MRLRVFLDPCYEISYFMFYLRGSVVSKLIMCIVGQTASGKSLAAMQIAKRLPISIISVDSAMVYQGCDIGTAKPSIADQAQVPHYLLDLIDPSQSYSVAQFMGDVDHAIQSVQAAGRIPLLVGGSMMYFHTLIHGISSLPATDMSVRQEVEALIESNGLSYVWEALEQVDPEAAARIHPHDRQRIIRAYGLYLQTGHSMKRLLQLSPPRQLPYDFQLFEKACRDLTELEGNIRRRVQIMMSQGLVEEATLIYDQLKGIATPAKKLIG